MASCVGIGDASGDVTVVDDPAPKPERRGEVMSTIRSSVSRGGGDRNLPLVEVRPAAEREKLADFERPRLVRSTGQ